MSLAPGTYMIRDPDSGRVLDCYGGSTRIGTWEPNQTENQMWRVKCCSRSSEYAFQSVRTKKYIPASMNESEMHTVDESRNATFHLEHGFQDFYLIRSARTKSYLCHPNIRPREDEDYIPVNFTSKATLKGCVWQFERIGHDASNRPAQRAQKLASLARPQLNIASSRVSGRLYPDDAHLYTDMLFNIPRMSFTRDQRIATLDWARRLGAANVPTIESLDECERRSEAALGITDNAGETE
ncbi:hypothetical protein ACGC1H_005557 [Rhizoctonia solani]